MIVIRRNAKSAGQRERCTLTRFTNPTNIDLFCSLYFYVRTDTWIRALLKQELIELFLSLSYAPHWKIARESEDVA